MGIDSAHYILYASLNKDCTRWTGIKKRPTNFMSGDFRESSSDVIDDKLSGFMEIVNDVN